MSKLPPKPPRFPPALYSRHALYMYALNVAGLAINGWLAAIHNDGAHDFVLFFNCAALALSLIACRLMVKRVRAVIVEWADLRRKWDEMNEYYNGGGQ